MKQQHLPLKPIPGSYGIPLVGPFMDRLDFFYHQGQNKFFDTKIEKYGSTVIRTNVPPGPFISSDSRVVALLDAASFPILFDNSKVEKRDVLVGTYMPSTAFTGGHRVCAYLDTAEASHRALKGFFLNTLKERRELFIPLFRTPLSQSFIQLEDQLFGESSSANLNDPVDSATFNFMFRLFCDNKDPLKTSIGSEGSRLVDTWLAFQFAPLATLRLPKIFNYIEDLLLHTIPYPSFLAQSSYNKLYEAFSSSARKLLEEAEKAGIKRDEACHNLVFMAGFNAYGGLKIQFPIMMKWVGLGGEKLHREIAKEVRSVVREERDVTIKALEKMSLVKSIVYEAMRIEPAIPYQLGKAREDIIVSSHDACFEIKKGETIFGYQPFATRDSRIFEKAKEFVARRFVGEEGEKLLKYVVWSNEFGTEEPSPENKQCTGKNLVVLLCRLLLVEFFLRYDTFEFRYKDAAFAPNVTITSLTKASSF